MIPIGDDNSDRKRLPIIVPLLVLTCVAAWLWQLNDDRVTYTWAAVPFELSHGRSLGPEVVLIDGQRTPIPHQMPPAPWMLWLTPLTAMFLHGSWLHLLGNMLYLWIFGDQIEDRLGRVRFLIFYLVCGLVACLAHVVYARDSMLPMVGASGAIAGVLGAYLITCPWRRVTVLVGIFPLPLPAILVLGFWFALQWIGLQDVRSPVAFMAHIGGFLAGLTLVALIAPKQAQSRR